jgi:hypothetical protein
MKVGSDGALFGEKTASPRYAVTSLVLDYNKISLKTTKYNDPNTNPHR